MARPPEPKSLVGYTVGKCVLQRICGRGAMGTVYQGMHTGLDIDVAVKVLPPHLASNGSLVQRFLREAKLAAKLNHANTVRVYDVGEESGYYYLVMEFVKGNDALDLIKTHGPLDAATVADIGAGAAKALAHAHANGVVHRDIKPANLMLPESGGVKVADFGLARATASDSGLTMTGAIMGTPDYMAPEQAQGKQAGAAADAYSLGGTLFHLFVGRPPFSASTPMAVALQHVTSRITVPQERLKTPADRGLAQIIHDLTEKEPERRLVDMNVVAERLAGIARMSRNTTQKLMSEGATLFATAGFRIDTRAIEKAKSDALAEMHAMAEVESPTAAPTKPGTRPPAPPNPMLDELRKVGAQVRSQTQNLAAEGGPAGLTQDLADLTPEMVREAKARARRSSGAIPALPRETGESSKRSSGRLPPITDDLPASASRRNKVAAGSDMDDAGWQEYSAKSFPTFERKAIADGSAARPADTVPAPWEGGSSKQPSGATRMDITPASTRQPYRKRSSSSGIGILLVLLLIGGGAFAGWYFYLRDRRGGPGTGQGEVVAVNLKAQDFQAQKADTRVYSVASLRDGKGLLTAGMDGSLHLWRSPFDKPVATYTNTTNPVMHVAPDDEGGGLVAVGAADGTVMLLDAETLKVNNPQVFKAPGLTSLLWPKYGVVGGDDKGRLWKSDRPGVAVSKSGARINALARKGGELYVATAAGELVVLGLNGLAETSRLNLSEGAADSLAGCDKGVFAVLKDQLRVVTANGLAPGGIPVSGKALTFTGDDALLVVVRDAGVAYIDPLSLKVVGTFALPTGATISSLGPAFGVYGSGVGTAQGRLFHVTHQP
ncbi:MAG TPA: protein kinase [Planctomycetota bacterium]|nr:protein kinase [Planctomycetota bacterium]